MFHDQVRMLIERQCRLLREEADRLGWVLAEADPDDPDSGPLDLPAARDACARVLHRADVLGVDAIRQRAEALDAALAELDGVERIRCWHMVDLMARHAEVTNAVDELEAEDTSLYAGCSAPEARMVAPPPALL